MINYKRYRLVINSLQIRGMCIGYFDLLANKVMRGVFEYGLSAI